MSLPFPQCRWSYLDIVEVTRVSVKLEIEGIVDYVVDFTLPAFDFAGYLLKPGFVSPKFPRFINVEVQWIITTASRAQENGRTRHRMRERARENKRTRPGQRGRTSTE